METKGLKFQHLARAAAMPLPKTASIAARATEVYSEVCQLVLKKAFEGPGKDGDAKKTDPSSDELPLLFPYLRQLLTCCACAGLLEDAMVSLSCGHCYCYECQFRAPLLKIQCRQCKERNGLVIEAQLRMVVKCYREMCHVLALSLLKKTGKTSTAPASVEEEGKAPVSDPIAEILREVREGVKVSRGVLVVHPPERYLTTKHSTPKNETAVPSRKSSNAVSTQGKSHKKRPKESLVVQSETRKKIKLANEIVKRRLQFPALKKQQTVARRRWREQRANKRNRMEESSTEEEAEESEDEEDRGALFESEEGERGGTADEGAMEVDTSCLSAIPHPKITSHLIWLKIPNPLLPSLPDPFQSSSVSLGCSPGAAVGMAKLRMPLAGRLKWRRPRPKNIRKKKRRSVAVPSPSSTLQLREKLTDSSVPAADPRQYSQISPPPPPSPKKLKPAKVAKDAGTPQIGKPHKPSSVPHVRPKMSKALAGTAKPDSTSTPPSVTPLSPKLVKQIKSTPPSSSTPSVCRLTAEELEELRVRPKFRCRCGTNPGVMFVHMICAKRKCPCYLNAIPCLRCKCRGCNNPYNKLPLATTS